MNMFFLTDLIPPNVNVPIILPELIVAFAGVVVMLYDSFFPKQRTVSGVLAIAGLAISGIVLGTMWGSGQPATSWNGMIVHDNLRLSFSFVFLFVSAMTVLISTVWVKRENVPAGEYHALLLFGTFGMMTMSAGNDLVIIFLGLETLSISTYVMAGLRKGDLRSNESAMKYFILGSFASAFLLYGMALIYGATGSTNLTQIAEKIADPNFPALLLVGAAMMIVGFGFKIAMAPFHVWTPDVYVGAPTPITAFLSTASKAAAFSIFARIFYFALADFHTDWSGIIAAVAALSMVVGNLAAITQDNVKRMLAYSSIAHAGYGLMGILAMSGDGLFSVLVYMLVYAFTNLGIWATVLMLRKHAYAGESIEDFEGLHRRAPWLAFAMVIFLLSLGGVPPTAGFIGKYFLFAAAVKAGYGWLAILAVLMSAVSMFYYLRLVVAMYLKDGGEAELSRDRQLGFAVVVCLIITLALGLAPEWMLRGVRASLHDTVAGTVARF